MSTGPKFSIITVCKNAHESIAETIDSLSSQSYRDFEYLVIDGASTDGTLETVRQHINGFTTNIVSESDAGIYDAMNKGISLAQGDWIYFLNAKDRFANEDVLQQAADYLRKSPEVDLFYGDAIFSSEEKQLLVRYDWVTRWNLRFEKLCHQTVFARRVLFQRVGNFDTRYRINADYDWLLRVFCPGYPVAYMGFPIAFYDTTGVSARYTKELNAERKVVRAQYLPKMIGRPLEWGYRGYRKGLRMAGLTER